MSVAVARTIRETSLASLLQEAGMPERIRVRGLCLDSRAVRAGDAFVALRGARSDGMAFLDDAANRGAVVALVESGRAPHAAPLPVIEVEGLATRLGELGARFYGAPSAALRLVGVTGTNGKTTCTQLLAQALSLCGTACGVIGTLGAGFPGNLQDTVHTTPDALTLQRVFAELRDAGAKAVAMEVSSHALTQGRVQALRFDTAVFTNLTHDHLDFHGSFEAYGAAKASLFRHAGLARAVVNADDALGRRILAELSADIERVGFALEAPAEVRAEQTEYRADGIRTQLVTPWGRGELRLPLLGRFNLQNALAVISVLGLHGVALETTLAALARIDVVPGRMQRINGGTPLVIVDYAHTPDALEQTLRALRAHCTGRLWCVFGCGGDRDRTKRPLMGRIAREHADEVIVTSDNPRSENPRAIIDEICAGIPDPGVIREPDRRAAIAHAIAAAAAPDCVLIAGKGHESYQEVSGVRSPFSDAEVARELLAARRGRG
jgi:UDP-N-acetylmuramoyl-L-alanyl-D-glutamate--2,6-diaminopimelate ligase